VVGDNPGSTTVEFGYDENIKAYDFTEHVNRLVDLVETQGSVVNATFTGDGEESDDFWQVNIKDNKVTVESGEIIYPSDLLDLKAQAWRQGHDEACTAMACLHKNPYGDPK